MVYFSQLYAQYEKLLRNVALKLTGSEFRSDNLLSLTFQNLWESPSKFKDSDDKSISTFLMKQLIYNYLYLQRVEGRRN
ncbi:sigma factor [Bacillus massiliglaciei]|uniref:sigma factor n=1 Tax=Bacillus massiliglaciei TaxID=1816693 RepID=UPI0038996D27